MSVVLSDSPPRKPRLTTARAPLTERVQVRNEWGEVSETSIPAERALTIYLDKREIVTLMTLGAEPELLVLGFLRNQRLVESPDQIESITVDWSLGEGEIGEPGVAAVKTRAGSSLPMPRSAERVVTTGCGQGSVFGDLMAHIDDLRLADARITQGQLYGIVNAIRLQESTYKSAGSVHGCALFKGEDMLLFVEDVGRHNAVDTIAGWMWMHGVDTTVTTPDTPYVFYTTGRLTSEMIIKSAQMGVALVVSRSGMTQMGHQIAQQLGLCAIGRATNKHFLCYSAPERLLLQPELAASRLAP